MTLYDRYSNGQEEQVYEDISVLGKDAFSPSNLPEIQKVLTETFQRVSHNLDAIYSELKSINYLFKTDCKYNFERPLHQPLAKTDILLDQLDKAVKPFGFVPLSLKFFYKVVGGVNFVWDYDTNENFIWKMADPVQITSIDALVETVTDKYWYEEMQENLNDNGIAYLELSADEFHKDNISGGPAYSLEITKYPSIDSLFLNEPNNTSFINYLRICSDNCGFPGIKNPYYNNSYQSFFDKVKPQIKLV